MNKEKNTLKAKENIIDILETIVTANRVFENIENVTGCCDLIGSVNAWVSIVFLMGLDLDSNSIRDDELLDKYTEIFEKGCESKISSADAARLIFSKTETEVYGDLKKRPQLKSIAA
ncbi:hypothetical protein [Marinifilum sp. D737]|uniref:hypothetical protein n=1 Tax=Marinifilum sp. D737 TaxID=2969628 RepID=UPI00227A2A78|nr:hypothetical protein [Marinifilum sp. D737]